MSQTPPILGRYNAISLCMTENIRMYTLECPKTAASFAHGVDQKGSHEQPDSDADSNLDHGRSDIEDDGIEAVGGGLRYVSNVFVAR